MLKKTFHIILFSILWNPLTGYAQEEKKINLSFSEEKVVGGYSVKKNSKSYFSGLFVNSINFKIKNGKQVLEFMIFPEGYESIKFVCQIDTLNATNSIRLILKEKNFALEEVTVFSKRNRYSKNGDTIRVFVEDIKTKPHAEATDLFDRIEGFENNDNGTFKVFGSSIDIVMIDGKRIYGGNPALTLSNINADMIKSIDIIDNSRVGNKGKVINLRLKDDKKSGFYANIGLGAGFPKTYDFSFKANRLLNNAIFSSFGVANNFSLFKQKEFVDNEIVEEFYAKNSFFGYQNKVQMLQSMNDDEEVSSGVFSDNSLGASLNFTQKKSAQSIFFKLSNNHQVFQSIISGNTITEEQTIQTRNMSDGQRSINNFNFGYEINQKFGKTNSVIFKVETRNNDSKNKNNDSSYYSDGQVETSRFIESSKVFQTNFTKIDFGVTIHHKNKRIKSLVYSQLLYDSQKNKNNLTGVSNELTQNLYNLSYTLEFIQSYPINKRVLIEHRPYFSSDASQFINIFSASTINATIQNLFRLDNWVYYQQGKALINANLSFWNYNIFDNTPSERVKKAIRLRKLSVKFPKSSLLSNFDFNYDNDLIIPQNIEKIGIADSSNFYFRQAGNMYLNPYFFKKLSVSYSNTNIKYFNLISAYNIKTEKNSIQNDAFFAENLLYQNSRKNIKQSIVSFNGNTFIGLKKLPKKIEISFNHIFLIGKTYNLLNNQIISGNNKYHLINFQTVIKGSNSFSFKNSLTATYHSFQNLKTNTFEHTFKLNYDIRNELFSKITLKSIIGSKIPYQPLINFECQKFILKNKIGIEMKVINLFNRKTNFNVNQNLFQQFISQSNIIPRVLILKLNIYPEKWK